MADTTSCRGCGREWTARQQCHCTACHEHFNGVTAFDSHQIGAGEDESCGPDWKWSMRGKTAPEQMQEIDTPYGPMWGWVKLPKEAADI